MATCTEAERALLNAIGKSTGEEEMQRLRVAILRERIPAELPAAMVRRLVEVRRANKELHRMYRQLVEIGFDGRLLSLVCKPWEEEAESQEPGE